MSVHAAGSAGRKILWPCAAWPLTSSTSASPSHNLQSGYNEFVTNAFHSLQWSLDIPPTGIDATAPPNPAGGPLNFFLKAGVEDPQTVHAHLGVKPICAPPGAPAGRPDRPLVRIRQLTSPAPRGPPPCQPALHTAVAAPFRHVLEPPAGVRFLNRQGVCGVSGSVWPQRLRE